MERSLDDALNATLKERAAVLNSALALLKIMSHEDIAERAERSKRGFIRARAEIGADAEEVDVSPDQAELYIKALAAKFGEEVVRKALEG